MASRTEMSSKNRKFGKLAGDRFVIFERFGTIFRYYHVHSPSRKTFSITNLNASLQNVLDEINATLGTVTGVNPENDSTGITIEYDSVKDKFFLDTNERSPLASSNLPVLGSTTDTSNFLDAIGYWTVLRKRTADFESGSKISIFNSGDGFKSWLHQDDAALNGQSEEIPYAAFNGSLYIRQKNEDDFVAGAASFNWRESLHRFRIRSN